MSISVSVKNVYLKALFFGVALINYNWLAAYKL